MEGDVEQNFRAIIESSPLPMCVTTVDRMLYANRAMLEYLGYPAQGDITGPSLAELSDVIVHPEDRARTREAFGGLFASLSSPEATRAPIRLDDVRLRTRVDAALRYCDMHGIVIRQDGKPALVTFLHDHTERHAFASRVRLADRMSALGTLAAGVAHEINNPLTYVITNVEYVASTIAVPDGEVAEALGDVREGLERIRRIVQALRTFSRSDDDAIESVELAHVVDAAIEMAQSHLRHSAKLVKRYADVPPVRGNAARLGQVFLNLLVNATQAFDEARAERNEVTVSIERVDDRAMITVQDNGKGIAARDLPRVFDAFYTTKPIGVGTGLGLFVCHGIISALGGAIAVESEEGRWTRMRVALPFADAQPRRVEPSPALPRARRGRVLVVDDEPLVLTALRRMLEDDHEVTAVDNGHAALELLTMAQPFDLVLCDLMMPRLSGAELYERAEALVPGVAERFVFMTGGAVTQAGASFLAQTPNPTVDKPFDPNQLLELINRRLAMTS